MSAQALSVRTDDGCVLHVEHEGSGPPLILISGLGGTADFWDGVRPALAQAFQLVVFDHRGTGRSARPADGYSIGRIAKDVIAIMDALGIERAHVVGHSTGGAVTQTLALDAADRVGRIVISGSWARADYRFRLLFETRLAVLQAAGPEAYTAFGQILAYPPAWVNENETRVAGAIARSAKELAAPEAAAARLRMLLEHDRLDDLQRITAPALVIGADDDMIVPVAHARMIAERIPGATYAELTGGHFFPRTMTRDFLDLVRGFLLKA